MNAAREGWVFPTMKVTVPGPRRIHCELLGPAPPIAGVAVAPESWRLQREMMAELLGEVNPPERRPGHEHGPLSDFPAAGALVA